MIVEFCIAEELDTLHVQYLKCTSVRRRNSKNIRIMLCLNAQTMLHRGVRFRTMMSNRVSSNWTKNRSDLIWTNVGWRCSSSILQNNLGMLEFFSTFKAVKVKNCEGTFFHPLFKKPTRENDEQYPVGLFLLERLATDVGRRRCYRAVWMSR